MATSASTPLRQVLEERVKQLVLDTENLFTEARDRARREMAEQLNLAVRRIRQTGNLEDLGATLVDATGPFCGSAAFFGVSGDFFQAERIRGVPHAIAAEFENLEIASSDAPALASAVESRDPVVTAAMASEVSAEIVRLFGHGPVGRASIYPVVARERVPALLYVWGAPQGPALELLVQAASLVWSSLTEPPPAGKASELIRIAGAEAEPSKEAEPAPSTAPEPAPSKAPASWEDLPLEEQRIHLKAQRFARVQASEMRLFEPEAVQSGRAERNLYEALHERIDKARETYRKSFFEPCPSMVDYLHLELVRTLGNDNPELLGKDYPGPMV